MVPVEEWARAVRDRHSSRTYTGAAPTAEQREALATHCETFLPFPGARAVFIAEPAVDVFTGIIGGYGRVRHSPSVLVFIGDGSQPAHEAKLGYVGEAAVLEATRLGLGTCWVSGGFDRRKTERLVELASAERVFAVSAVGTPAAERRLVFRLSGSDRKALSKIAPGTDSGTWPSWAFEGATLARLAPSAVNRQPWLFRMDGDTALLSVDPDTVTSYSKAIDCGIAMLHFELGALTAGGVGGWEFLEAPDIARYRLFGEGQDAE